MNDKEKWIKKRLDAGFLSDPLRDQAISNVRAAQEEELEGFRETSLQDELEVAEFERLVKKVADTRFGVKAKKRTRQKKQKIKKTKKTARGKKGRH